ncbi:hypothetical protein [Vannielia sp.]|uniref:hypothetical protein n=1 Tax=Vannielia sp. TaxID=2813045 RepID=UPI00260F58B7|nr:hypothetical protein [Vannielia sp.]MDF1873677.1 hypothetical protein [Vannielia sp.]
MTEARLTITHIQTLLDHPEVARALHGLARLRVSATGEAGAVAGEFMLSGCKVRVSGPVDLQTGEQAFHITRAIPRDGGHLRVDFSYPPRDLSGSADFDETGRISDIDTKIS